MKKTLYRIVLSMIMLILCAQPIQAIEAFVIDDVYIEMDVHEDGTIDIKEKYSLDFDEYRHGFYRNIPNSYSMDWTIDGKLVNKKYYFPIKNIACSTDCSLSSNDKGVVVKMGDPDRKIIGKQSYTIAYTIKTKDLDLGGEQMLYWNLLSGFDTTTKNLSYKITMPKPFDQKEVYAYSGAFGEVGSNLSAQVSGNVISGKLLEYLGSNESATIKVNLEKGYFVFPEGTDYSMIGLGIAGAILVLSIILFMKYGKDDDVIVTVEFKAPDGLDSAGVGYVIDNMVDNKDILSLIIDWANRGFLLIHDEEIGFKLEQLKKMDETNSHAYEREFFNALFMESTIVSEEDLKNETVRNGLAKAKNLLSSFFTNKKERKVYTSTSLSLQVLMLFIIVIPTLAFTWLTGYEKYEQTMLILPFLIPVLLIFISCIPWIILMRKRYVMKHATFMVCVIFIVFLNGLFVTINGVMQLTLGAEIFGVLSIGAMTFINIFFMVFMDKRTKQGNRWLGQILGLKEFIESCEKDRLELLVKENPTAFYQVLPYAYVLGISDTWVKKFEEIVIPEPSWYRGIGYGNNNIFMTMLWWHHFDRCFSNISSAATYVPPAKGGTGGGSFGGGGFGGGFSGGGFGGGGGGSW